MGPAPALRLSQKASTQFADSLRQTLKSAGLTQRELSEALGKSDRRWVERTIDMRTIPVSRFVEITKFLETNGYSLAAGPERKDLGLAMLRYTIDIPARMRRGIDPTLPMLIPKFAIPLLVDKLREFLSSEGVEAPTRAVLKRFVYGAQRNGLAAFHFYTVILQVGMKDFVSDGDQLYYVNGDSRILVDDDSKSQFEEIATVCGLDPQRRLFVSP